MCQAFIMSAICFQVHSACNFVFCHLLLPTQMTNTVIEGYDFQEYLKIYLIAYYLAVYILKHCSNLYIKNTCFL